MSDSLPVIRLRYDGRTLLLPYGTFRQAVLKVLPDLITKPYEELEDAAKTVRLGLKLAVRSILGVMAWALQKENPLGLPMPDEQAAIAAHMEITAYAVDYTIYIGAMIAARNEWEVRYVDAPAGRTIVGIAPAEAIVAATPPASGGATQASEGAPADALRADDERGHSHLDHGPVGDVRSNGHGQNGVQQGADGGVWRSL